MATNNFVILNFLDLSPHNIVGFSHEYLKSQCVTALTKKLLELLPLPIGVDYFFHMSGKAFEPRCVLKKKL